MSGADALVRGRAAQVRGDITYFLAPYINSYKRFQVGTFAPTKAVWSRDNRTAGFRLCGEGSKAIRIDAAWRRRSQSLSRVRRADRGGPRGREEKLDGAAVLGRCLCRRALPEVPKTLREATGGSASEFLRAAFGYAVVDHYVHTANGSSSNTTAASRTGN